jgi:hypothetical protein
MPLSTSNFNNSSKPWIYTWLIVLFIGISTLGGYEYYLKQQGFVPSIKSNKNLWSWYRSHVYHHKQMVLIGASRSQIDIDVSYLKDRYTDYDVSQLSINGQYPIATLKALAEDEYFTGVAIISMNAQVLETKYLDMQKSYNIYYQEQSTLYKSFDAYLTAFIQSTIRFLHPSLGLEEIVKFYQSNKRYPDVFYTTANLDQSITTDYTKTNNAALLNHFVTQKQNNYLNDPPTKPELWKKNIKYLIEYVTQITKRGGLVVFVRFPTDKGHWELDEKYYPRNQYWDLIAKEELLNTLHFKDIKGVEKLDLPDSSHLDSKDSKEFTELLFNQINIQ